MSAGDDERRLRIVVPRYGEEIIGGAETLARAIALRLAAAGRRVSVLTTCALEESTWANRLPPGRTLDGDVEVHRFPVAMPRPEHTFRGLSRGFFRVPAPLRPERAWLTLQGPYSPRLHLALRADPTTPVLFVTYLFATTVRGIHEVPAVRLLLPTAHDERPLHLAAVGRAFEACDGIWYGTLEERELVERVHPQVTLNAAVGNVGVEPPLGVDPMRFRGEFGVDGDYLLYAGRSTAGKGVDELLTGVDLLSRSHPGVRLVVCGEAGRSVVATRHITPVGTLSRERLWDAIAGAVAVVVPSFHESLSLLALEAWAVGRPALLNAASPVLAGQAERSGAAITYRGAEGLADAAAQLLDDGGRARTLGDAGRAYVAANHGWDAVLERFEALLAAAEPLR